MYCLIKKCDLGTWRFGGCLKVKHSAIFESNVRDSFVTGMQNRSVFGSRQSKFILTLGTGEFPRSKADGVQLQTCYLIQPCSHQRSVSIARIDEELVQVCGFGIAPQLNLIWLPRAVLFYQHGNFSRGFLG